MTRSAQRDFAAVPERAARWNGLRQDSGDPFAFAVAAKEAYQALGIDPSKSAYSASTSLALRPIPARRDRHLQRRAGP
jgi:nicotinate phosphoribosyltransferase